MWTEPICDRTAQDAADGTPKGCCNAADLNRLEDNIAILAGLVGVTAGQRARPWAASDFATNGELLRLAGNIAALRGGYHCYRTTPPAPEHPLNSWEKWNAAEQILSDIHRLYYDRLAAKDYAGELSAGERIGVL